MIGELLTGELPRSHLEESFGSQNVVASEEWRRVHTFRRPSSTVVMDIESPGRVAGCGVSCGLVLASVVCDLRGGCVMNSILRERHSGWVWVAINCQLQTTARAVCKAVSTRNPRIKAIPPLHRFCAAEIDAPAAHHGLLAHIRLIGVAKGSKLATPKPRDDTRVRHVLDVGSPPRKAPVAHIPLGGAFLRGKISAASTRADTSGCPSQNKPDPRVDDRLANGTQIASFLRSAQIYETVGAVIGSISIVRVVTHTVVRRWAARPIRANTCWGLIRPVNGSVGTGRHGELG